MESGDDAPPRITRETGETESPVRAIQNAALERALLSPTGDDGYVAFVGALEQTRTDADRALSLSSATILACLLSLHVSEATAPDARTPHFGGLDPGDEPLLTGALVAFDRFSISLSTAATLANRSVDDFETELVRRRTE